LRFSFNVAVAVANFPSISYAKVYSEIERGFESIIESVVDLVDVNWSCTAYTLLRLPKVEGRDNALTS